jgi:transposase
MQNLSVLYHESMVPSSSPAARASVRESELVRSEAQERVGSDETDVAKRRLALLQLAARIGSVAEACRTMGFSRGTFYRMKQRYEARGEDGLRELDRRGRVPKNRLEASIETLVVELALAHPTWGRRRFVALLAERGITISASGIRLVWKRHGLLRSRVRVASARALSSCAESPS